MNEEQDVAIAITRMEKLLAGITIKIQESVINLSKVYTSYIKKLIFLSLFYLRFKIDIFKREA